LDITLIRTLTKSILQQERLQESSNLRTTRNVLSYYIDDPNPPYKGVRGKGKVKIHEEISHNIPITEKIMTRYVESLEDPMAQCVLDETKNGNLIILEITPSYYSTWDYGKSQ
jgi:hypothetical protein